MSYFDEKDIPDLSLAKKTINCRIENISMHGVGFSSLGRHRIVKNARIILGFLLDNPIDPAIKYVMPECFCRASIPLDSRLRGNDGLDI